MAVLVGLPVLQIDHAHKLFPRMHRHRQERLEKFLGQFVERPEARILKGVACYGHGRFVLRDPTGDSLPHPQL